MLTFIFGQYNRTLKIVYWLPPLTIYLLKLVILPLSYFILEGAQMDGWMKTRWMIQDLAFFFIICRFLCRWWAFIKCFFARNCRQGLDIKWKNISHFHVHIISEFLHKNWLEMVIFTLIWTYGQKMSLDQFDWFSKKAIK